jgi:protein-tyrosine-phosphatase
MGENSQDRKQGSEPSKILFVCTANVCRSPMAEHLFAREIDKVNLPIKVESCSAGLSAMDGDKASQNSLDACQEIGLDISSHKSSGISRADLQEASVIFCMTESHRALINMYFDLPEGYPIFLMREFVENGSRELPDPYGQDIEVYRECRDRMLEAIPSLINWVEKNL